ncbi:MAG: transcriptional regulator [Rhodobacterales bacterium]|nr:MAG: transcriptional regulator [Rhodobacterales bacterium]
MGEDALEDWYDPAMATFGDRVAGAREAAGMDQKTLAKRLGVKLSTLQAWENDMSEPRANRLSILSGLLNVSLSWLLDGVGEGAPVPGEAQPTREDIIDVLTEIADLKARASRTANRLGALEKRLRVMLQNEGVL